MLGIAHPEPPHMHDLGVVRIDLRMHANPGSQGAVILGCTCPIRSNHCGDGATALHWGAVRKRTPDPVDARDHWLIDRACPLHGALRQ